MSGLSEAEFLFSCFKNSGWLASRNLKRSLAVGDVCSLQNGQLHPLLNMAEAHLVERAEISRPQALPSLDFCIAQGAHQAFFEVGEEQGGNGDALCQYRQVIEFSAPGSFVFHAGQINARYLLNWSDISADLILKLTQLHYQFREVYVVTAVAACNQWGLAIAGRHEAILETSAVSEESGMFAMLNHRSSSVDQAKGLASYEYGGELPAHLFRAKKLIASEKASDRYLRRIIDNQQQLRPLEVANWLQSDCLNLARNNELTLNSCMELFSWRDALPGDFLV